MRPAIFLDKDGTLLDDVPFNVEPARMRLAPGAAEGLYRLAQLGAPLVVVSNQSGVAERRFDESALHRVGDHLAAMFGACGARLAGFHWCPHARDAAPACPCRKPAPGMLVRAAAELALDLSRSWMIGDILDDIEAGHRAGCRAVLIDNGNETEWRAGPKREPDFVAHSLADAAETIALRWPALAAAA
ncbi:D-glycero-alpha-D-manno-heptose-1,7-bisphosphate 7-phosphatase [Solimonas soli]|uniref:D-glycero-alpha-D-manno-heptose-1,7-bisphosphate 7-phosphatase n=1 Tax=Solimonas soli TaxID=413479 RepID=UPI000488B40F|nr:HAD family hydrolase [Solimonas soli]